MSPNSNQDRHGAGERLKALGLTLEGAVLFHWIVLHHSASPDGKSYDWPGIRTYHMSYRYNGNIITKEDYDKLRAAGQTLGLEAPWSDCGYHLGIEDAGGMLKVSPGRPLKTIGSHVSGFNQQSLGICHVGNFDKNKPSDLLWATSIPVVMDLMRWFGIPTKNVVGHREVYPMLGQPVKKSCPGDKWDCDRYRDEINVRLQRAVR